MNNMLFCTLMYESYLSFRTFGFCWTLINALLLLTDALLIKFYNLQESAASVHNVEQNWRVNANSHPQQQVYVPITNIFPKKPEIDNVRLGCLMWILEFILVYF